MARVWTPELDRQLTELIKTGISGHEIAAEMKMRPGQIYNRASRLGLTIAAGRGMSESVKQMISNSMRGALRRERLRRLSAKYPSTMSLSEIVAAVPDFPVTRLPLGAHIGWRPSWWKNFV